MVTVGELKRVLCNLPDSALVIYDIPTSSYSFEVDSVYGGMCRVECKPDGGKTMYVTINNDGFEEIFEEFKSDEETPPDAKEFKQSCIPAIIFNLFRD